MSRLVIGTRSSKLAVAQTELVAEKLREAGYETHLAPINTRGDAVLDRSLHQIGGKGLFTQELEAALAAGTIDLAVHSLKDLPTELPSGLAIGAYALPADRRDVLLSQGDTLAALPSGARVGTSSLRRMAFLKVMRPDLTVVPIRGNLHTRVQKWRDGQCDALLLAAAGVLRLGWAHLISEYLDPREMVPSPGQGILAVEAAGQREDIADALKQLNDEHAMIAALAERAVLRELGGGCQIPLGAYAEWIAANRLCIRAQVASLDGQQILRREVECYPHDAALVGQEVGRSLKGEGAIQLMQVGER